MTANLQKWQRSAIRNSIEQYRKAIDNYYIRNKRIVEMDGGLKAFSLLSHVSALPPRADAFG